MLTLTLLALTTAAGPPRLDAYGDPLPDGAVARLGSVRLRHPGMVAFAVTADGATARTVDRDGLVRSWELPGGRPTTVVALRGPSPHATAAFSPDGRWVAGVRDGRGGTRVVVWDAATGRVVGDHPAPGQYGARPAFAPDGTTLAVGSVMADHAVVLNWQTGDRRTLPVPPKCFAAPTFSPDGRRLAAGRGDGPLVVFDVAGGKELFRTTGECAAFAPDGKSLAVAETDGDRSVLRVLAPDTGAVRSRFEAGGRFKSLLFAPDGRTLAAASWDGVRLMDVPSGRVRHRLPWSVENAAFAPGGTMLVTHHPGGRLRLWDPATGRERDPRPGHFDDRTPAALSPDGRRLAAAEGPDREDVLVWEVATGRPVRHYPLDDPAESRVEGVGFSADGRALWAGLNTGRVQAWDAATAARRPEVALQPLAPDPVAAFTHVGVSPDGRAVAALGWGPGGGHDERLGVWDAASGDLLFQRPVPDWPARAWAWAGPGRVALSVGGGLEVLAADTGAVRFRGPPTFVDRPAAVSPDGRLVAVRASADGGRLSGKNDGEADAVAVWEVATGREAARVRTGPVGGLALAAGGRTLVVTAGGRVAVWDVATGKERGGWDHPPGVGGCPAVEPGLLVSADGRRAFTRASDGTGLVWDLSGFPVTRLTGEWSDRAAAGWWADLGGADARAAAAAGWRLAEGPADAAVAFVKARVTPASPADAKAVAADLAGLDSGVYRVREGATGRLYALGPRVEGELRRVAAEGASAEARRRAGDLLARMAGPLAAGEAVRAVRAVAVLEQAGTAEAHAHLKALAGGAAGATLTTAARAAVERRRPEAGPSP